MEEYIHNELRR